MSCDFGCYMPYQSRKETHIPVDSKFDKHTNPSGPFFKYILEEQKSEYTVNRFLAAMKTKSLEDAAVYLSKNYADRIDLTKLEEILSDVGQGYSPFVIKASYESGPKNCKTNTVMLIDQEMKRTSIFHIYMLPEPDRFGKWKIYGIEQE